jgi:hypothetical protein
VFVSVNFGFLFFQNAIFGFSESFLPPFFLAEEEGFALPPHFYKAYHDVAAVSFKIDWESLIFTTSILLD